MGSLAAAFGGLVALIVACGSRRVPALVLALVAAGLCALAPIVVQTVGRPAETMVSETVRGERQGVLASLLADAARTTSLGHRIEIWVSVADRAVERPLTGWGLDATRRVPATREQYGGVARETIDLHPHNGFLQVWLELGAFGGLAAAAFFISSGVAVARRFAGNAWASAASAGVFAAALVIFGAGFGAFQSWWLASLFTLVAFLALAPRRSDEYSGPSQRND
ncbi:MAG: O-antigen ligase family protein [Pseudomonadota bacterium]